MKYEIKPIGIIHSPFSSKEDCPIQGGSAQGAKGRIEIFLEFEEGLKDIETFSHVILFYLFDRAGQIQLVRPPFLDDEPHGVFATRHPCRPNGIGISTVKLESRHGHILQVSGIDVLDQTPLIDLKPYVPRFDCFAEASNGWLESRTWRDKPQGRE